MPFVFFDGLSAEESPGDGKKTTAEMVWSCPRNVRTQLNVSKSHSLMERSVEQETKCVPVGENATELTVFV